MARAVPPIDEVERAKVGAEREKDKELERLVNEQFNARFKDQAPRGLALAAVGQLDEYLKEAIQLLLVPDKKLLDSMFDEMRPLGSFGARIRLAYLLGICNKTTYDDLIKISKIRNYFAHDHAAKDFDYPEIKGLCEGVGLLKEFERSSGKYALLRSLFSKNAWEMNHIGSRFAFICLVLQADLKFWAHQIKAKRGPLDFLWTSREISS